MEQTLINAENAFTRMGCPAAPSFTSDDLFKLGILLRETNSTLTVEIPMTAQKALVERCKQFGFGANAAFNSLLEHVLLILGFHAGPFRQVVDPKNFCWIATQVKRGKDEAGPTVGANPELTSSPISSEPKKMTTALLLELHEQTCGAARDIMRVKNHDYTDGSVDPFANFRTSEMLGVPGELGILIRSLDKFKRIQTFINKGTLKVKGESVDDAIQDVINYMILLKGMIRARQMEQAV